MGSLKSGIDNAKLNAKKPPKKLSALSGNAMVKTCGEGNIP